MAIFNLSFSYLNFQEFKNDEVFKDNFIIKNIYPKKNYDIIKIQHQNFTCFTKISKDLQAKPFDNISIYLITKKVNFIDYIKGFYTNSFNLQILDNQIKNNSIKSNILYNIDEQHTSSEVSSLYQALFLATSVPKELREVFSAYGISHLIAISGFHLGVISVVLYFILHFLYAPLHQRYIPYRNKRFDILIFVSIVLFIYLLLIDLAPSFLRSFVMFIVGIIFLRNNIKILSFETLLVIVSMILALYPKLFFSLSLWFSVAGVFYIFLYLQYFKNMNKYISFVFFNFWIFLAINPIVHFIFYTTSIMQIFSPIFTILFTIFYPLELLLHIVGFGNMLDGVIEIMLNYEIGTYSKSISPYFFYTYVILSLCAIKSKRCFIVLNIFVGICSIYLFIV